jgi:ubiquinone/menaquinone biosynthesis C-methylase UbiE
MPEVDLMRLYPKAKNRAAQRPSITEEDKRIAKQFGQDYFDGDRRTGYGGFTYHERFWAGTVRLFRDHYRLPEDAAILDIGCAKGFMLYDFMKLMPHARIAGIDISEYAIANAIHSVRPFVQVGNARSLPFADRSFDLVLAVNTIHNLPYEECKQSLREIQRVSRQHAFVMVDAYRTEEERQSMLRWVLTAETLLPVDEWLQLFAEAGYTNDYCWWAVE